MDSMEIRDMEKKLVGKGRERSTVSGKVITSKTVPLPSFDFGRTLFSGLSKNSSGVIIRDILLERQATGQEIIDHSETLAKQLLSLGCGKGDVVATFSPNSIEWLVVIAAAFRIGAVTAGINALILTGELQQHIRTCKAKFLYTVRSLAPLVLHSIRENKLQIAVIVKDGFPGCISLESLLESRNPLPQLPTFEELALKPSDPCLILFSSGTTGLPKAVLISHRNLHGCLAVKEQPDVNACFDNQLLFSPFSHAVGALWLLVACARGFTTNFFSKFDIVKYLEFIETNRLEILFLMPPVATRLAKSPEVGRYRLDSVKSILSSSAPLSKELSEQLIERFPGVKIRQGYGMTETTGFVLLMPDNDEVNQYSSSSFSTWKRKLGSIGVPVCNAEVKVIDLDSGIALGAGRSGELCIRSPTIMLGYFGNPEASNQTIDKDDWMHTGDIAYYDEDGYFFIIDRLKELIKYNAYQVAPAELEAVLLSHPEVADAAVFGLPDEAAGEIPTACVVQKPGSTIKATELEKFVAGKVAPYKRLRGGIRFVATIPKSASGKVLRRELKASVLKGKL